LHLSGHFDGIYEMALLNLLKKQQPTLGYACPVCPSFFWGFLSAKAGFFLANCLKMR